MTYISEYKIKGYTFVFTNANGEPGIIIPHFVPLDDTNYIHALQHAQSLIHHIDHYEILSEVAHCYWRSGFIDREEKQLQLYAEEVETHKLLPISEIVATFIQVLRVPRNKRPKRTDGISTKQTHMKPGYVYLLRSDKGVYKIGLTKNPESRQKTFDVLLPFDVEYECLIKTDDMKHLETELHTRFADKRVNGEWFNLTNEDVQYIKSLAEKSS